MRKILLAFSLALLVVATTGYVQASRDENKAKHDLVYQICTESRTSATLSEGRCSDIQNQLHIEYLCKQNNANPDNYCWTESVAHNLDLSEAR